MIIKIFKAKFINLILITALLIVGCAFNSKNTYTGRTMFIPVRTSPEGARITLDGEIAGYSPATIKFTYLTTGIGSSDDEVKTRILRVDLKGHEPYELSFSIKGGEHRQLPNPIILKKLIENIKEENLLSIEKVPSQKADEIIETVITEQEQNIEEGTVTQTSDAALEEAEAKQYKTIEEPVKETKTTPEEPVLTETGDNQQQVPVEADESSTPAVKKADSSTPEKAADKIDTSQSLDQAFFTIQLGTYTNIQGARKHYNATIKKLDIKEREYLRIDRIGQYYPVRVGKFVKYDDASVFLKKNRDSFPNAIILKAPINHNKIIELYK